MSQISLEAIRSLREQTSAGVMDCKKALEEAGGDVDRAIALLQERGLRLASKKSDRSTQEGVVESYIHMGGRVGAMVEVNCETDFVAKNEDFINFVKELSELNNSNNSDIKKLNKTQMKNKKKVDENLVALIAKIGEKITIGRAKTFREFKIPIQKAARPIKKR